MRLISMSRNSPHRTSTQPPHQSQGRIGCGQPDEELGPRGTHDVRGIIGGVQTNSGLAQLVEAIDDDQQARGPDITALESICGRGLGSVFGHIRLSIIASGLGKTIRGALPDRWDLLAQWTKDGAGIDEAFSDHAFVFRPVAFAEATALLWIADNALRLAAVTRR
jgi:hypothetical protein